MNNAVLSLTPSLSAGPFLKLTGGAVSGNVFIGDTVNSFMTLGLTINQGAADDEILVLKSSDIAHGMTTLTETDTYGAFTKTTGLTGGLSVVGNSETDQALTFAGRATSDVTTKTISSTGCISFRSQKKAGTTVGSMGADANLVVFRNNTTTRLILDAEGTIHQVPDSDIDMDLTTVQVTGTPTLSWDESEDSFSINKGLRVTSGALVIGNDLLFGGELDTKINFDLGKQTFSVDGIIGFQITETTQDLVEIGDVVGTGDWDININSGQLFVEGSTGGVYIGDTSNSFMTQGLTINQGAAADEIIALKSSDVAHGMTTLTETDTYGQFQKAVAVSGGLLIGGYTEASRGFYMVSRVTSDITTKTTSSRSAIELVAQKKSGTATGVMGANANLVTIQNLATTRWILDAEGDVFYGGSDDGTITDEYDDSDLLIGFRAIMSPKKSPAYKRFKGFLKDTENILVQQGILTAPLQEGGLVSDTALKGLLIDSIYQLNEKLNKMERQYNGVK